MYSDDMATQPPIAQQLEFFEIPSPCVGVCESGPRGFCKGCYRSREERLYWLQIDDGTRRKIISACHRRKQAADKRNRQQQENKKEIREPSQTNLFDETPIPKK